MKSIIRLFLFIIIPCITVSCVDDRFMDEYNRVEEGLPANIKVKFNSEASKVVSRVGQEAIYENQIGNIYVFVFKENGDVHYRRLCKDGDGLSYADGDKDKNSGFADISTSSLNRARIIGIANIDDVNVSTVYNLTKAQLDAVMNFDELNALVMQMPHTSIERGSYFMMTGYAKDTQGSEFVNIPGSESGEEQTLDCILKLRRVDAKVKFEVRTSPNPPTGVTWTDFSFVPKEWTVKRVPQQSYILEHEKSDYDGGGVVEAKYFTTPLRTFEETYRNDDGSLYEGGSFVFYMPENRKNVDSPIETTGTLSEQYAKREAWNVETGENENGDKPFLYAPENATYVEMTGTLSYKDGSGYRINADVCLTVHLGYVTKRDGQSVAPDPNDYNTDRNNSYTYRILVRGINDIIVEVTEETDKRPGYEGDVVYSSDRIFEFDSHYDRRLIKLNKKDILDDMKWSVITPFSHGIHEMKDEIPVEMRDYRWVKFAVNKHYGVLDGKYVKYPGDQNYNDPYPMQGRSNNETSPSFTGFPDARLMDVDQLIKYLQKEANNPGSELFDNDGNVAITVFVDENVYYYDPRNQSPVEQPLFWKKTADKEDRQLHIIAGGSKVSPDGNSSIVNSKVSFKQRSLRTIFNVDKEELTTAWGLESVMETERLKPGDVSKGESMSNGRKNCFNWLVGKKWTEVLSTDDHYKLQDKYNDASFACLLRNRDNNGDNVVDADEVRWYLASIDQLTDIYLGEYALDEKSRLYPVNDADRPGGKGVYWHYTTSSYNVSDGAAWILWAEEGASRGTYSGEPGSLQLNGPLYSYRCVRNLGIPLNDVDTPPTDLIKVEQQSDGTYLIDVTNMSIKARRTNKEIAALPLHNERDADNRPYAKFLVGDVNPAPDTSPKDGGPTWTIGGSTENETDIIWNNSQNWLYFQTSDNQKNGYRIPVQRELLIMSTRLPIAAWPVYSETVKWHEGMFGGKEYSKVLTKQPPYYISQTAFSMKGKPPYNELREGFIWSTSGVFFLQNNKEEKGYVRLVKDTD